ncbi:hypothetical protein V8E55_000925 [Tylopilus felleus]
MRPVTTIYTRGLRLSSGLNPYTRRHLHATPWVAKSVKEKISDVADKVNKKVGEGLASAIETGEKATEKTKKTLGAATEHAQGSGKAAKKGAGKMGQKAKEAADDARAHHPPS